MTAMTTPEADGTDGAARPPRAVFSHALRSEWTKFWTLRSTPWTLVIAVVLMVAISALSSWGIAQTLNAHPGARNNLPPPVTMSLSGTQLGMLVLAVLGVLVISSEYRTGMIRSSLIAVPQRMRFLAAKLISFAAVVLVVSEIMAFVSFLISQSFFDASYAAGFGDDHVLRAVIGAGLLIAASGVFGVAVGALVRSVAGSIAIALGALLILPQLLRFLPGQWGDTINQYFLTNAGQQVKAVPGDPAGTPLGPWVGYGVFWAWIAAVLVLAALLLHKRDA